MSPEHESPALDLTCWSFIATVCCIRRNRFGLVSVSAVSRDFTDGL
jgi:hypothetical protein